MIVISRGAYRSGCIVVTTARRCGADAANIRDGISVTLVSCAVSGGSSCEDMTSGTRLGCPVPVSVVRVTHPP
jgi:hypothetical protein